MLRRFGLWIYQLLISIDQLFQVILAGPKYVIVGGGKPDPDETISSKVGRASLAGKRWAKWFAEPAINALMFVLTGHKNHCFLSIGH
jgi:hypothetical protein